MTPGFEHNSERAGFPLPPVGGQEPDAKARREEWINHVLDLEAEGRTIPARALARQACAVDPDFAPELAEMRASLADLTPPSAKPDLTEGILWAVEARRPFLPRRSVRRMSGTRVALACGALAALTIAAFLHRITMSPPPSDIVSPAPGAGDSLGTLSASVGPSMESVHPARPSITLSLGDTSHYGLATLADSPLRSREPAAPIGAMIVQRDPAELIIADTSRASKPRLLWPGDRPFAASVVPVDPMSPFRVGETAANSPQWSWPGLIDGSSLIRGLQWRPAKVQLPGTGLGPTPPEERPPVQAKP